MPSTSILFAFLAGVLFAQFFLSTVIGFVKAKTS